MYEEVEPNSERWFDLTPLKNEIWRDVKDYEDLYQVSNYGRVKRLSRFHNTSNSNQKNGYHSKEMIMKTCIDIYGYYKITFYSKQGSKSTQIHRVVANAFLDVNDVKSIPSEINIDMDKLQVNHKDENKLNNRIDNLEWCTVKYNVNYGTGTKRRSEKMSIPILQFDLDGNFIREWRSATKAMQELGIHSFGISNCCNHKRKQWGGFKWEFKEVNND